MNAAWRHVRSLWPGWGWLSPLPFVLWAGWRFWAGEVRWEYVAVLAAVGGLAFWNARSKKLYVGLYPIALLGLVYDAMRFVESVGLTAGRVHLCDLRALDARLIGSSDGSTVHDWLQAHSLPWLDRLAAIPYGTFIFMEIGFAIFLFFKSEQAIARFGWTFLLMNLMGFATYHLVPAAPPWYFHAHGCAVDLTAHASEGPNLARVDAWLGVRYFHGFYGRSNDVFGALPSLHVAYPALILLEGWRWMRAPGRAFFVLYTALMAFAAVYLDHHWVVDVLLGLAYVVVAYVVVYALVAYGLVWKVGARLVPAFARSAE